MLAATMAALLAGTGAARAAELPDAATLLFEEPQLEGTAPGTTLTYAYARRTAKAELFGPSFDDRIRLMIETGDNDHDRTVRVDLFSGERHRPAGPFEHVTGNPVLILFLENHVIELASRLNANQRYLKNAIRAALRDRALVEATEVAIDGRASPAWRVRITPFRDDPNKARMHGLDALTYDFVVAAHVPGEIAEIRVTAPDRDGTALID